jgi:predicted nucleic acid-binding protein
MLPRVCIDAGMITQYYARDCPANISALFEEIKKGKVTAFVPMVILVEAFFNICKLKGKTVAEFSMNNFMETLPVEIIQVEKDIMFKAGALKCQFRRTLSYNDCTMIALALNRKLTLHTTEKEIKKKIPALKLVEHSF